jgi:hypothetical protein
MAPSTGMMSPTTTAICARVLGACAAPARLQTNVRFGAPRPAHPCWASHARFDLLLSQKRAFLIPRPHANHELSWGRGMQALVKIANAKRMVGRSREKILDSKKTAGAK